MLTTKEVCAAYESCLFVCLLNFLPYFFPYVLLLICFVTGLLPNLSVYSFQNRPVRFQAGGRRR